MRNVLWLAGAALIGLLALLAYRSLMPMGPLSEATSDAAGEWLVSPLSETEPEPDRAPDPVPAPVDRASDTVSDSASSSSAVPDPRMASAGAAAAGGEHSAPVRPEHEGAGLEAAAREYIADLSRPDPAPIPADQASHFVTAGQSIGLASGKIVEETTVGALRAESEPDRPIAVVRTVRQMAARTPEALIAESRGDLDRPVRILRDDRVIERSLREVLSDHAGRPGRPISVIEDVEYLERTTVRELAAALAARGASAEERLRVIRRPFRLESIPIRELVSTIKATSPTAIYYVHTVRLGDEQGVWGIIHEALIENFSRGVALRRGESLDTYRVEIPQDADERLPDHSSSFLGRLIDRKSRESAVYNFRLGRMTQNPDLVMPGEEILIVDFEPDELVAIYKHFVANPGAAPPESSRG